MGDETDLCQCGHLRNAHYVYCCNSKDQMRCRECDPLRNNREGLVEMVAGSKIEVAYRAADHNFMSIESHHN